MLSWHLAYQSATWFLEIKVLRNSGLFQTLEKFQVLHTWIFFSSLSPGFFSDLWYKSYFFSRWRPRKIIQVCRIWNFCKVWSRSWFFKTLIFRNQGADLKAEYVLLSFYCLYIFSECNITCFVQHGITTWQLEWPHLNLNSKMHFLPVFELMSYSLCINQFY